MAKDKEEIQEHIANRKLTILKGFKEVSEKPLILLKDLQEQVGKENVHSYEVVKGFTGEVLEKGTDSDKLSAKDTINNLVSVSVVDDQGLKQTVYVEKGVMDSKSSGGRQGLVKKQLTDKTGKNTTRWVKQGEDDKKSKDSKVSDEDDLPGFKPDENDSDEDKEKFAKYEATQKEAKERNAREGYNEETGKIEGGEEGGVKTTEEHASDTSSEDLQAYLEKNPDGEHAGHAKQELESREEGDDSEEGEEQSVDYANLSTDELNEMFQNHPKKDAIIESSLSHNISIGTAMQMIDKDSGGSAETHAKIDAAQGALNDLKEHTGHPDATDDVEGGEERNSDEVNFAMKELYPNVDQAIKIYNESGDDMYIEVAKELGVEDVDTIVGLVDDWITSAENGDLDSDDEDEEARQNGPDGFSDDVNDGNDEGGNSDDMNTTMDEASEIVTISDNGEVYKVKVTPLDDSSGRSEIRKVDEEGNVLDEDDYEIVSEKGLMGMKVEDEDEDGDEDSSHSSDEDARAEQTSRARKVYDMYKDSENSEDKAKAEKAKIFLDDAKKMK